MKLKYLLNPIMLTAAVAIPTVSLSSCKESVVEIATITISASSTRVKEGSTLQFSASINPTNASNTELEWVSNNETIVSFKSPGLAEGVSVGSTGVYAKAKDGSGIKSNTVYITVTSNKQLVTGISLESSIYVVKGKTTSPVYSVSPSNATNKTLKWTSSNPSIASINSTTGLITGIAIGTTTITATATDGSEISRSATVNVTDTDLKIQSLSLSNVTVNVGETSKCSPTISPSYATNKTLNWKTGDTTIATVSSDGTVSGKKAGTTTLTATTTDGSSLTATSTITVKEVISETPSDYIHNRTFSLKAEGGGYFASGTGWIVSDATPTNTSDYVYNIATNWHVTDGFSTLSSPITYYFGDDKSSSGVTNYYKIKNFELANESYSFFTDTSLNYTHTGIDLRVVKMDLSNAQSSTKTKLDKINKIQQSLGYITRFADDATSTENQITPTMYTGGFPFNDALYTSKWEYHEIDTSSVAMKYYQKSQRTHEASVDNTRYLNDISPQYGFGVDVGTSFMSGGASGSMLIGDYDGVYKVAAIYWGGYTNQTQTVFYPSYSVFKSSWKNFLDPWI